MRGKVCPAERGGVSRGITPAHAGKRDVPCRAGAKGTDHPRPCGEKRYKNLVVSMYGGSPPPMRGKVRGRVQLQLAFRITPAHAGKSAKQCNMGRDVEDHPRPCGEKMEKTDKTMLMLGSPPPMRGKDSADFALRRAHGITPAHAGKSRHPRTVSRRTGDHPRPCGEKPAPDARRSAH